MRVWNNGGQDSGSVHCLGNGGLCAYGQGPEIIQLFGPPYSSPTLLRLEVSSGRPLRAESTREPGTAIWKHELTVDGAKAADFTDFVTPGSPCLVRIMDCRTPVTLTLRPARGVAALPNPGRFPDAGAAMLLWAEAGTPIYGAYPTAARQYMQVLCAGEATYRKAGEDAYELTFPSGRSALLFCGGPGYPDAVSAAERMGAADPEGLLDAARQWWRGFTGRRRDFESLIPAGFPQKDRLLELIDSVSVLIRAQQGAEGGVLAGSNYHLGYIRDQYGVFRCLLALGYAGEAGAILRFYWDVWRKHGRLHNAQGIGADAFHVHENDGVEITGYLVIQAFDYLEATGDEAFVEEIAPMLLWAFGRQKGHLVRGMLPFNGDETYIAGGMLSRDCINHGSAEATMLFAAGGRRLLRWAERRGLWSAEERAEAASLLGEAEGQFEENFLSTGQLVANNPERLAGREPPAFRHGVCQQCNAFGWTERASGGLYLCPPCREHPQGRQASDAVHVLKSVSLMPLYVGSTVLPINRIAQTVDEIMSEYRATGRLPSTPDADGTVGYDYGLLLYNLTRLGHPAAGEILERMLSVVDDTDAWVEYYVGGKPANTRCRPWESGINLHAAIEYALGWQQDRG